MTETPADTISVRVAVIGRVQGVWFRAWTVEQANRLGLKGWVRNRADGAVEAVFSGPRARVDDMVAACRRGPPAARVDDVTIEPCDQPGGAGFIQRSSV
jgi:acylphosphatase